MLKKGKVEVNALINKKGDILSLIQWGLFYIPLWCIALNIFNIFLIESEIFRRVVSILGGIGSGLLIFLVNYYFSKSCKCLGSTIYTQTSILAYSYLISVFLGVFNIPSIVKIVPLIVYGVFFIILAVKFKNNYSGLLECVGKKMLRLVMIFCIMFGYIIIVILLFVITSFRFRLENSYSLDYNGLGNLNPFYVIVGMLFIGLVIWLLWATYSLYKVINHLMENGYDEYYNEILYRTYGNGGSSTSVTQNSIHDLKDNISTENSTTAHAIINPVSPNDASLQIDEKKNIPARNYKRIWIIVCAVLIIAGAITIILQNVGNNKFLNKSARNLSKYTYAKNENTENNSNHTYAEIVLPWDLRITLKSDHTIPELSLDAFWQINDDVIEIFTGEGTTHWTIIDGYLYDGYYEDGQCWIQDWDEEAESLYDKGYIPIPSRGKKIKSIEIYDQKNQNYSYVDRSEAIDLVTNYHNAIYTNDIASFFEDDGIDFFKLKNVDKETVLQQISKSSKRKSRHDYDWSTLRLSQLPSGDTKVIFESDYYIYYDTRTDKYRLVSEFIFSPKHKIKSINDLETTKIGSL